jgi:hypothetical protein
MVELHSNYTPVGQKYVVDRVYPTNHQEHETLEITQGLTSWSEVGFYVFTSWQNGHGAQMGGGSHPAVSTCTRFMALASGCKPLDGGWLSARGVFTGYVDVGNQAYRR